MKIYDISQEVFSCSVYPGDPAPQKEILCSMNGGDLYNLTAFFMCAHNGTHIDAPAHFLKEGETVERLPLHKTVGYAFVAEHSGVLDAQDAGRILRQAREQDPEAAKRILIKGDAILSEEGARVFADAQIDLFGNESQTVGPPDAPMAVHLIMLRAGVVLLEGVRLEEVREGAYLLCAQPLCLAGAEGAPCRALLIDQTDVYGA
ncbi:MAG: cyclase family protein [Clostridia bacterium]|nr:cyclase family protein [Clostridia bacterium]